MCRLARGSHAFHREVKAWETLEKTRGVIPDDDTDKDKEDTEDTENTEDADDNDDTDDNDDDTDDNDDDIMMIFAKQH